MCFFFHSRTPCHLPVGMPRIRARIAFGKLLTDEHSRTRFSYGFRSSLEWVLGIEDAFRLFTLPTPEKVRLGKQVSCINNKANMQFRYKNQRGFNDSCFEKVISYASHLMPWRLQKP